MRDQERLKISVFLVPAGLLAAATVYSLLDAPSFTALMKAANNWILGTFGPLFSIGAFLFLVTCLVVLVHPAGKIKIGGKEAVPLLGRFHWFSITLCTTIAIGILFWAGAEPLYHLHQPPEGQSGSAPFAMSTLYLHWTLLPYAMYTLAGLMFAIAYFNHNQPFAVQAMISFLTAGQSKRLGPILDIVCLYSLVAGMAASLSAGLLTIAGGAGLFLGVSTSPFLLFIVMAVLVAVFVASAASGILRGIRSLSFVNTLLFALFLVYIAMAGPTQSMVKAAFSGLIHFGSSMFSASLGIGIPETWQRDWTWFYWSNWLAWTPVTALFLGRIAVGYSVRAFVVMNLLLPSLFSAVWMSILGGYALHMDASGNGSLWQTLQANGVERVMYALLTALPGGQMLAALFLITAFVSFVTAADSNTAAMSRLSVHRSGQNSLSDDGPVWIKLLWGSAIGLFSWTLTAYSGIDGIRLSSVLGGFPVLLFMLAVMAGAWRWLWKNRRYSGN
jgi:choline-glycine betaine transporter